MIVSHKHKFIFIKTAKTAGTTVEIALSEICGPNDIITPISPDDEEARKELGFRGPQNYLGGFVNPNIYDWFLFNFKRKQSYRYFNHAKAKQVYRWVGKDIWDSYYKFSIDRHPVDKFVSFYYWRGGDETWGNVEGLMKSRKLRRIQGMRYYGIQGKMAVDKVYKLEDMQGMFDDLSKKFKLEKTLSIPQHRAKSNTGRKKRHYSEILSSEQINQIRNKFQWELDYFGYD